MLGKIFGVLWQRVVRSAARVQGGPRGRRECLFTVCAVWVHLVSDCLILGIHGGKVLSGRVALSVAVGRYGSGAFCALVLLSAWSGRLVGRQ